MENITKKLKNKKDANIIFSFNINKNKNIEEKFEIQRKPIEVTLKALLINKKQYELLNGEENESDKSLKNSEKQDNDISAKYYHYYKVSNDKIGWRLKLFLLESLEEGVAA